jgi:hypothetical protein
MAGNIQADTSGDILVEFDYNNLIVVDPNKTIDNFGNIKERLVDHESLVMYANLEAEILPRTKLAVGGTSQDRIRTISVAKINFLKPTKDNFLGVGYYDELTGRDTVNMKGQNQSKELSHSDSEGNAYIRNTVADENGVVDNGLLGITQINITTNTSFVPSVKIELEDVQGKALFQLGNNSPYAAFFNLPYPQFYLTLKGYYGQAIRYQLNLEKFNARFNGQTGNYQISLEFRGYKFNILTEVSMGHLLATPHMYSQIFTVNSNPEQLQTTNTTTQQQSAIEGKIAGEASNSQNTLVTQVTSERGYQKIREVYSDYKSKGLVPPDLPELTLVQLMNKLENFENFIINSYPKANLEPLTNIRDYKSALSQYYERVRGGATSWYNKYLDPKPLVLKDKTFVFVYKKNLDKNAINDAKNELNGLVRQYSDILAKNKTLGVNSPNEIKNNVTVKMIQIDVPESSIDWALTTTQQTGIQSPTQSDIDIIKRNYNTLYLPVIETTQQQLGNPILPSFYVFEGDYRFNKEITSMESQANKKLSEYETAISADLADRLQSSSIGLGFKPTVRNVIGVIMASAEAFIRLLDDVHTNAWDVKYDPVRKRAILDNPSSAPSSDSRDDVKLSNDSQAQNQGLSTSEIPVYPWPQFFVETSEDKKGRFQLKYIADPSVVDLTQGYLYDKWPEVEFVEEFMKGLTQKFNPPVSPPPLETTQDTNRININAIEYPQLGLAYLNKSEVKFFYEIWERQFLTSYYTGIIRANLGQTNELINLITEAEVNNIVGSLGVSSPYLSFKLKNYNLTAQNYPTVLESISNNGTGRSYQDFIRDFFVTPYIKTITENSFSILSTTDLGRIPLVSPQSKALQSLVNSPNNEPILCDTFPFRDYTWNSNNMADSRQSQLSQVYNTNRTLKVFGPKNLIANFTDVYNFTENRPVTNFSYLNISQNPTQNGIVDFDTFYTSRISNYNNFIPTEGLMNNYSHTKKMFYESSVSMLNTPYFINAIQNGVYNQRKKDLYPYIQAAYLFINSLPIASLKEKYKTYNDGATANLDYIASVFKKYGAIHKMPYAWVLKMGSVWHRYKKYKETGVDIIESAWTDFDYLKNYSPVLSSTTQTYSFDYSQSPVNITLQSGTTNSISLNVGFYPKVINDFNYFYNGFDLYSGYTNQEIQRSVNLGLKLYNYGTSNINGVTYDSKSFREVTYSVLAPRLTLVLEDPTCNPKNNTKSGEYYIIPSFGSNVNQLNSEGIQSGNLVINPIDNSNIYNGTVRTLWSAPNYGYFDSNSLVKPEPDEYLNKFFTGSTEQSPFRLLNENTYSKIEEIFAVFEKKILDQFETEFLNFSKPETNVSTGVQIAKINQSLVDINSTYKNFQVLFKSLMSVNPQSTNNQVTDTDYFNQVFNNQLSNFGNTIKNFLQYDIILRYGNPSNYRRRIFDSFRSYNSQTQYVTNPIQFDPYVQNSLPSNNGLVTLSESKQLYPEAWFALETEVGFSTISGFTYTNNGSYITDFFIDNNIEFSENNVVILTPLIRMYATQKSLNTNFTPAQFKSQLDSYLQGSENLQNYFLNSVLSGIKGKLPKQDQLPEKAISSVIDGQQSKVENYEVFKAINDKWISGNNFTERTLFEDILFLDRASRNIGDTILIDIFDLKNMFSENSLNQAMSVYTFISGILIKNNFTVMNLPAYVNFYNVQDADGTTIPQPEGSLDFANNMWGTFLNVDYRKSSPKMVCFYVGKPSQYLDLPKGNFRYRDDGFEMRRASENPLIENQENKKDWAVSNKCVGFNVDIGIRNQNIFHTFSVSQDSGKATSESINTQLNMVDQASGRNTATQNVGLYNLYKNRSYQCTVSSLGNALLQPTMYFNLRHVPMFNGPYMILQVDHAITPGNFQTTFSGIRQGIFDLPSIDNFLQQVNQNLLTRLQELIRIRKDDVVVSATTDNQKSSNLTNENVNTKSEQNSCTAKLNPYYANQQYDRAYVSKESVLTKLTPKEFSDALLAKVPENENLRAIIYSLCYLKTFENNEFYGFDNNFVTLTLTENLSPSDSLFLRTYSCVNTSSNKSEPIANFESLDKFLDLMISRITPNVNLILQVGLLQYYVCSWPKTNISQDYFLSNLDQYEKIKVKLYEGFNSAVKVGLINELEARTIGISIELNEKKAPNKPGVTPTHSPQPQDVCPPPLISSISPLTGVTGTIVQINGRNLLSTTGITYNNVLADPKSIVVYNDETIRFSIPTTVQPLPQTAKIVVRTKFGNVTSTQEFTQTG